MTAAVDGSERGGGCLSGVHSAATQPFGPKLRAALGWLSASTTVLRVVDAQRRQQGQGAQEPKVDT
jgi:hypothetical protein